MVWPVAVTAHLFQTFGALLDVTSSAVFTTLQHLFPFRYGLFYCIVVLFRWLMSNALIFFTGVFALGDCPLIALR